MSQEHKLSLEIPVCELEKKKKKRERCTYIF